NIALTNQSNKMVKYRYCNDSWKNQTQLPLNASYWTIFLSYDNSHTFSLSQSNNDNSESYGFTDLESDSVRTNDKSNNNIDINNSESGPNINNTGSASNNVSESSHNTLRTYLITLKQTIRVQHHV
ncbi:8253_t:CDS:2, partial [Gigaspora rosea]